MTRPLTVKRLIKRLLDMPPDAVVAGLDLVAGGIFLVDLKSVELVDVQTNPRELAHVEGAKGRRVVAIT